MNKVDSIGKAIKDRISGKYFSFTSDIWSTKYSNDSFLDLHIVWIEKGEIKYCQLEMISMPERHTGENIKHHLDTAISQFIPISEKSNEKKEISL